MARYDGRALRRIHMGTDVLLVSLGWISAYWLRFALSGPLGRPLNSVESYTAALPIVVVPWIFSCWLFGIYASPRMRPLTAHLRDLIRGVLLGLLVLAATSFFFRELGFGRTVVLFTAAINLGLQGASRVFFYRFERRVHRSGEGEVPALILGAGTGGIRLLQKLQDHPEIGYRVEGFLVEDDAELGEKREVAGRPVLGTVGELREVILRHGIEEIFVAMPSLGHTRMLSIVLDCEDLDVTFRVVTNLFEVLTAGTPVELVDDLPLVRLGRERPHAFYERGKRLLDLAIALPLALACLPVVAWAAWRIRRESPGPALFTQRRVGRYGREFTLYKLRTMGSDAAPYAPSPTRDDDPRVSELGRFLRGTSIDELPQLWNVLRGEMSLVGPRPEMPFIVDGYDDWQRRRLSVKPGMTGLWQILGRKDLPMQENLQYDFYYIRNRSLLLDLSILLRTVGAVLLRRGAF